MKQTIILLTCLLLSLSFSNNIFAQKKSKDKKETKKEAKKDKEKTPKKDKSKEDTKPKEKVAKAKIFKAHKAYLMPEKANIRKEANTKSDIVMQLATGSELTVVAQTKESATIENVTALWYKVAVKQDTTEIDGYIWGGYLSDLRAESRKDAAVNFLLRRNNDKEWAITATKNGVFLNSIKIPTAIDNAYKIRNNVGYDKINDAIILSGKSGEFTELEELLIWDGKKIYHAATAKGGAKPGTDPMHHETFVVDGDKGAKKGCILKVSTDEIEWDGSIYQNSATTKAIYKWNGEALIE